MPDRARNAGGNSKSSRPSGCRRASMIFAFGRTSWMKGTNSQLFGSLSMKNGRSVRRCTPRASDIPRRARAARPATASRDAFGIPSRLARQRPGMSGSSDVPSTRLCDDEDLLDQRRSGPRHADDEDRVRRLAPARPLRERLRRECVDAAVNGPADARPARYGWLFRRSALRLGIMGERLVGPAGVVHRLAEREIEVEAVLVVEAAGAAAPPPSPRRRLRRT